MFSASAWRDFLRVGSLPNDGSKQGPPCWVPARRSAPQTLLICFREDVQGPWAPQTDPTRLRCPRRTTGRRTVSSPRNTANRSPLRREIRNKNTAAGSSLTCRVRLTPAGIKVGCVLRRPAEPPAREAQLPRPPRPHAALPSGLRLSRDSRCGPTPTSSPTLLFPTGTAQGRGGRSPPGALCQVLLQ